MFGIRLRGCVFQAEPQTGDEVSTCARSTSSVASLSLSPLSLSLSLSLSLTYRVTPTSVCSHRAKVCAAELLFLFTLYC